MAPMTAQQPVLTVTLSPTVDVSTEVPEVLAGPKLRCVSPRLDPGGGGINVSRAIALLGGASTAFVAFGGATGMQLGGLMAATGIPVVAFAGPGETRQSLAVIEATTGRQFRFVMPGATWPAALIAALPDRIAAVAPRDGWVVLSGSQPGGFTPDFPRNLVARLAGLGSILVDTSGAPLTNLAAAAVAGLSVLRMDSEEAQALAGDGLTSREATVGFAARLVTRGVARAVIVAHGADGSVLADSSGGCWFCRAPKVRVRSKVGAGDSFVGAYVLAVARGEAAPQALARGVAAASAAVMTEATELCRREDAERLVADCVVSAV